MKAALYGVILAGGGGTRLWPMSRVQHPKHLLTLCGDSSMVSQTSQRITPLIPCSQQLVITVEAHADAIRKEVPCIPGQNVIVEPSGRGTGPCIGLMALLIHHRDPDAIMVAMPADHVIADETGFIKTLECAIEAAQDGHLVTFGIVPGYAETGYGYIQRGGVLNTACAQPVYRVQRFAEKPDLDTARHFVASGEYYWNSGIFVWRVATILQAMRELLPDLYSQLVKIEQALGTPHEGQVIRQAWSEVDPVSIDVGIMEKADDVVVVPADIGWNDVGCWTSVAGLQTADEGNNIAVGEHIALDCHDTYIRSSGRLVAALGLEGMIVIDTGDAVLVCPKSKAQDVKKIVQQLKDEGKTQYL